MHLAELGSEAPKHFARLGHGWIDLARVTNEEQVLKCIAKLSAQCSSLREHRVFLEIRRLKVVEMPPLFGVSEHGDEFVISAECLCGRLINLAA